MKKNHSKLIALFISLMMICTLFPLQIFAVSDQEASTLTSEVMDGEATESVGTAPEPSETTPEPNETEPSETTPEPTETTPEPTETEPSETTPEPSETTPESTETTPEPSEAAVAQELTPVPSANSMSVNDDEVAGLLEEGATFEVRFILVGSSENPEANENPYQIWLDDTLEVEEGTNAWEFSQQALKANGYIFEESIYGNHLQKVIPPTEQVGQIELEGGVTNGEKAFWMWSYNDNIDKSAHEYAVQEGDVIRWYFSNSWEQEYFGHPDKFYPETGNPVSITPDASRPSDLSAWWPAFGGSMDHNSVKNLEISLDGIEATEVFAFSKTGGWMDSFSDPIQIGDWIYVVFSDTLYKLNADGSINEEAKLEFMIDSTARISYASGLVLVPMKYGKIQALTADRLATVWIADAPNQIMLSDSNNDVVTPHSQQSLTTIKVSDGIVYQGTCTVGWSPRSYGGTIRALSLNDGSTIWEHSSTESGFYWSGGALLNGVFVVGNDLGEIFSYDAKNGTLVDKMELTSGADGLAPAIRTNMIPLANQVYFISQQDGTLHRLDINSDGSFGELKSVKFCDGGSTASPTIMDGKIYAAGPNILAVIDAVTLKIEKSYDIDGAIQGTPLAVKDQTGSTYVFFTINKEPGAIYGISENEDIVHTVFTPDEEYQNWCMASISVSPDGTLYYSNDSHTFFAVKLAEKDSQEEEIPTVTVPGDELPATGESFSALNILLAAFFFGAAAVIFYFRKKLIERESN